MPKIVGYYDHPYQGLGAGLTDLIPGFSQASLEEVGRKAAAGALPVIEEKINEKMLIAGGVAAVGFVSLAALIWYTRR